MTDLEHHKFKRMYYVFAFIMLFFVSTVLGYVLFNSFLTGNKSVEVTEYATPTPEIDESKSTESLLDQETEQVQDDLSSSDLNSLDNEDLSGLE